jgi:hypothetical protein
MTRIALVFISVCAVLVLKAQQNVGIGTTTPAASAALEIEATDKGLLIPRMDSTARKAISSPAEGLMVFDSTYNVFYYYANSAWQEVGATGSTGPAGTYIAGDNIAISNDTISASFEADTMNIISDADNDTKIQVEESADEDIIRFDMEGTEFFRMDGGRLEVLNTGNSVFIGNDAGLNDDFSSNSNVGIGEGSLWQNEKGELNTAIGLSAMLLSSAGSSNIAVGASSLYFNSDGNKNVAVGVEALSLNNSGDQNTALGYQAGQSTLGGSGNVFIGHQAGAGESGSNKLYIDNSSTSSPLIYGEFDNDLLAINGTLRLNDGTQSDGYVLTSDADGNASWQANTVLTDTDNDTKIQLEESSDEDIIRFDVAGTEAVTIDNSGYVGIGTSSPDARLNLLDSNRADLTLQILDNDAEQGIAFQNSGGAYSWNIYRTPNGNNSSDLRFAGAAVGSSKFQITDLNEYVTFQAGGNVGIGVTNPGYALQVGSVGDGTEARANVWNTFSDRRWKKDFEIIPDALKKLNQVNGYFYNWKEGVDTTQQVGVIAQEIEEILPQAVSTDENGYKSVDYSKLTAWLIQVNKEQQAQIKKLKTDKKQTAGRLNALEAEKEATNERLARLEALLNKKLIAQQNQ